MEAAKTPHFMKAKNKQVKDELDRIKQAEKKSRRLEKALKTSAAIRSELEKKKQMTKEEQQRFEEEKAKKKQMKDELDPIKQAEKKRMRLEKALKTSAAIRSELEKKKQMKKEEQQRLDEEGAAIAEAVALHVLLGEDSEEKDEHLGHWARTSNIGLLMDHGSAHYHPNQKRCSFESAYGHGYVRNHFEEGNRLLSSWPLERSFGFPCFEDQVWGPSDVSAGLIAAQAVSSLRIGEDVPVDTVFFNRY